MEFERPNSQAIGSEGLPKMFAILFSVFFLSDLDFGFVQLNVENRPLVLYVMIGLVAKILQLVDVSGCPVESGLDAQVIFHMDLGILENQDPIPSISMVNCTCGLILFRCSVKHSVLLQCNSVFSCNV